MGERRGEREERKEVREEGGREYRNAQDVSGERESKRKEKGGRKRL